PPPARASTGRRARTTRSRAGSRCPGRRRPTGSGSRSPFPTGSRPRWSCRTGRGTSSPEATTPSEIATGRKAVDRARARAEKPAHAPARHRRRPRPRFIAPRSLPRGARCTGRTTVPTCPGRRALAPAQESPMLSRRRALALLAASASAPALASCGPNASPSAGEDGGALRVYWWGAELRAGLTQEVLDLYSEDNPDLTIEP